MTTPHSEDRPLRYSHYVLGRLGAPEPADYQRWSDYTFSNDPRRRIGHAHWDTREGVVVVTTEFTGINADDHDPPELWVTDAFLHPIYRQDAKVLHREGYTSRDAAEAGHARIIEELRARYESDI